MANIMKKVFALCFVGLILFSTCGLVSAVYYDHIIEEDGRTLYVIGDLDGIYVAGDIPADVCADDYTGDGTEEIGSPDVAESGNNGHVSDQGVKDYSREESTTGNVGTGDVATGDVSAQGVDDVDDDDAREEVATGDVDTEGVPEVVDNTPSNNAIVFSIVDGFLKVWSIICDSLKSLFFIF